MPDNQGVPRLELVEVSNTLADTRVLRDVSLDVAAGEVHTDLRMRARHRHPCRLLQRQIPKAEQ